MTKKIRDEEIVTRYLRILSASLRVEASKVLNSYNQRRESLNTLIVIKAFPEILDAFSSNKAIREGVIRATILNTTISETTKEQIINAQEKYKSIKEIETIIALSTSKEKEFIQSTIQKFEEGSVLNSLQKILKMEISQDKKRIIILFLEQLRNLHILGQQLVKQLEETNNNLRSDVKSLRESYESEDELYEQLQKIIEQGTRSKITNKQGTRLIGLKGVAAGFIIACNLLVSACGPKTIQAQPEQEKIEEESIQEEKAMTALSVYENEKKYPILRQPAGYLEIDPEGKNAYMIVGSSPPPILLTLKREDKKSPFSGEPRIIPAPEGQEWLKLERGNNVYAFTIPNNGSGNGKMFILRNGNIIPVILPDQRIDFYDVTLHATKQGDLFIYQNDQEIISWTVDSQGNTNIISIPSYTPQLMEGDEYHRTVSTIPSPSMNKFAFITMRSEEKTGDYFFSIAIHERNNNSWNMAIKIEKPRGAVIEDQLIFDDSERYISFHAAETSGGKIFLNIYDTTTKKTIFKHEVRAHSNNTSNIPMSWIPGTTTLLFTRVLPNRMQVLHKVTISNGEATLSQEIIGKTSPTNDVQPTIQTEYSGIEKIVFDKNQKIIYIINWVKGKIITSVKID